MEQRPKKWATCPLTQLGFIRLSATPAVVGTAKRPAEAAAILRRMVGDKNHVYLDCLPSPLASGYVEIFEAMLGSKQVTDGYLLRLAEQHNAVFLTFDTRLRELAEGSPRTEVIGG